jgi:hypothetical protein
MSLEEKAPARASSIIREYDIFPGSDFSFQQFGANLEIEVSDADNPDAVRTRIQELSVLLSPLSRAS